MVGVTVDGKAVRGAVDAGGEQTHLLAAATHGEQLVIGQVQVGVKSNEIPQFAPLISGLAAAIPGQRPRPRALRRQESVAPLSKVSIAAQYFRLEG